MKAILGVLAWWFIGPFALSLVANMVVFARSWIVYLLFFWYLLFMLAMLIWVPRWWARRRVIARLLPNKV